MDSLVFFLFKKSKKGFKLFETENSSWLNHDFKIFLVFNAPLPEKTSQSKKIISKISI